MSFILGYILVFGSSLLVDCIPIFAPPAWMVMVLIMAKYELNPWAVAILGNLGTAVGRIIYAKFIVPWVGKHAIGKSKQKDLEFVGKKLSGKPWHVFTFVTIYSLMPLSTTALFTAAGLASVNLLHVIPAFFIGHTIGDILILVSGHYAIDNFSDMYEGFWEPKSLALMALGLLIMFLVLFIDWRQIIEKKKLRLKWEFWK